MMDKGKRREELMNMYCTNGMMLEDVFEMIIDLEEKVGELESELEDVHARLQEDEY